MPNKNAQCINDEPMLLIISRSRTMPIKLKIFAISFMAVIFSITKLQTQCETAVRPI